MSGSIFDDLNILYRIYFSYFKYNDYERKVDYRKAKAGPWLGCGRVEPK